CIHTNVLPFLCLESALGQAERMFVLSFFKLRVGTALSADWLRPFALDSTLHFAAISVNRIYKVKASALYVAHAAATMELDFATGCPHDGHSLNDPRVSEIVRAQASTCSRVKGVSYGTELAIWFLAGINVSLLLTKAAENKFPAEVPAKIIALEPPGKDFFS